MGQPSFNAIVSVFAFIDLKLLNEMALSFANSRLKELDQSLSGFESSRLKRELLRNERIAAVSLNQ